MKLAYFGFFLIYFDQKSALNVRIINFKSILYTRYPSEAPEHQYPKYPDARVPVVMNTRIARARKYPNSLIPEPEKIDTRPNTILRSP